VRPPKAPVQPVKKAVSAKPAPVKATAKPAPVKAAAKPAPVKAAAKPAPAKVPAKPVPQKAAAKPASPPATPITPEKKIPKKVLRRKPPVRKIEESEKLPFSKIGLESIDAPIGQNTRTSGGPVKVRDRSPLPMPRETEEEYLNAQ